MPKPLTLADLDARIETLKAELALLDHAMQLAHATGDLRKIRAAEEARQLSLRDASRAVRQRQKLTAKVAITGCKVEQQP